MVTLDRADPSVAKPIDVSKRHQSNVSNEPDPWQHVNGGAKTNMKKVVSREGKGKGKHPAKPQKKW